MLNKPRPTHWSKKPDGVVLHAIALEVGGDQLFVSSAQVISRRCGWIVAKEPRNTVVIGLAVLPDHRFLEQIGRGQVIDGPRVSRHCVCKLLIEGARRTSTLSQASLRVSISGSLPKGSSGRGSEPFHIRRNTFCAAVRRSLVASVSCLMRLSCSEVSSRTCSAASSASISCRAARAHSGSAS